MKKDYFAKLSNEELIKKIKLFKGVLIGFSVIYAVIILVLLYLFLNKNFGQLSIAVFVPLLVLPATLSPLLISYNMHRKEFKLRNL
jgi:hypothetical protein